MPSPPIRRKGKLSMAPRATGFAKKPAAAKAVPAAKPAPVILSEPPPPSKPKPLKLARLIAPYKKHGRLAVRVERVPQKARLTHGRNNGNGSWSLASDELDGLEYQPPDGVTEIAALAIRIIGLDQDGATLAVVDLPASGEADALEHDASDDAYLSELAGELEKTKALLAAREAEISELRHKQVLAAPSGPGGAEKIIHLHQEMESAQTALRIVRVEAEQAARRMERDLSEALATAEESWKAGEAQRAAAAELKLRAASDKAIAQLTRRCEQADAALAEMRAKPVAGSVNETELRHLRDEEAALTAKLAERAAAIAASGAAHEAELRRLKDEHAALTEKAASSEAASVSAREAELRRQKDEQTTLKARLAEREAALNAATTAHEAELKRLNGDRTASNARLAERDKALAVATSAHAAELQRLKDEQASLNVKLAEREAALSDARSKTASGAAQEAELRRLKSDYAALGTKLADRDAAFLASNKNHEIELRRLKDEQSAANTKLSERETALAEAQSRTASGAAQEAGLRRLKEDYATLGAKLADRDAAFLASNTLHELEVRRLKDDGAATVSKLAEREAALSEARSKTVAGAAQEVELRRLKDDNASLSANLADREAKSLAYEAELQRLKDEQAAANAKLADREAALFDARARADGLAPLITATESELRRVKDEHAATTGRLMESEAALAGARALSTSGPDVALIQAQDENATLRARLASIEAQQNETAPTLAIARTAWQAEETARFAAAKVQADAALAFATSRFEAAEATIAELRTRAHAASMSNDGVVIARLRGEMEELQRILAECEAELALARKSSAAQITLDPDIFIDRPSRRRKRPRTRADEELVQGRRHLTVDMLIVMLFAAAIVLAWPFVLPLLPNDWQWYIYETTTSIEGTIGVTPHPTPPAGWVAPKPIAVATLSSAIVTHGANIRTAPSGSAAVVWTLNRGETVATGEVRGSWTAVQAGGKQGWVFSSYLKSSSPAGK